MVLLNQILILFLSVTLAEISDPVYKARQKKHDAFAAKTPEPPAKEWDYIVVGSGTSGSIVSCRLAQSGCGKVLLLEAGGPQDAIYTDIPLNYGISLFKKTKDIFWSYMNQPQRCGKAFDIGLPEIKGKVLGGSGTVNFMMYQRGHPNDYEGLAEATGDPTWSYKNLLPIYMKNERNFDTKLDDKYHGRKGVMGISTPQNPDPIMKKMFDVAKGRGFDHIDPNGANNTGVTISSSSVRNGIRQSSANAFIESGVCPSLVTITEALVTKILFKNENGVPTAEGVVFQKDGKDYDVLASKEVILSAGPMNTPQLLMLSGIGPADHLKSKGIEVLKDLPVGNNLCNHPVVFNNFPVDSPDLLNPPVSSDDPKELAKAAKGQGLLSEAPYFVWLRSSPLRPPEEKYYPNQNIYITGGRNGNPHIHLLHAYKDKAAWKDYLDNLEAQDYFIMFPLLTRPYSRGTIRLNTTNPNDPPIIDSNLYSDPRDWKEMIEFIRFTFDVVENDMKGLAHVNPRPIPGCSYCPGKKVSECDSYLNCFLEQYGSVLYHPVGTAQMGAKDDPTTVVDNRLKVLGTDKLRVVDSSIYRHCSSANANAPSMLVGEMGAIFVTEDNSKCLKIEYEV